MAKFDNFFVCCLHIYPSADFCAATYRITKYSAYAYYKVTNKQITSFPALCSCELLALVISSALLSCDKSTAKYFILFNKLAMPPKHLESGRMLEF